MFAGSRAAWRDNNGGALSERRVRISRIGGWPKKRPYSRLNAGKVWWWQADGAQFNVGLRLAYDDRLTPWADTGSNHSAYTWTTDPNCTSRHIMNRLSQSTVSDGTATLMALGYDNLPVAAKTGTINHDDANYGPSFRYRRNVTTKITPTSNDGFGYDEMGQMPTSSNAGGIERARHAGPATNSVPAAITPNGNRNLTSNLSYAPSLAINSIRNLYK